jgi:hypothetical protein
VTRLSLGDVAGAARLVGAHDVTLADAFEIAQAAGVLMPTEVDVYGVEAADVDRIEEGLSPEVAATVASLAREIHRRLDGEARERTPVIPKIDLSV